MSAWRRTAVAEAIVGVALGVLALLVTQAAAQEAAEPDGAAPLEETPSAATGANRTPRPGAPPREVGERYDSDAALPASALRVASYTMTAKLDADAHTVFGESTIEWTNTSTQATREIWLHLYLNAFKNDQTIFLRSRFGGGRSGSKTSDWGYVDVKKLFIRQLGDDDLWPTRDRHSPGEERDETDIRIPLPSAVEPNQTITIELEFESKLPDIVERTGHFKSFHMVAQWFPKIARLEPDGTWVHFPFHAQSEFYADYGRYDVTLDVPKELVVGATGPRVEERLEGDRKIVRHVQSDVHDFAWTAWDRFRERVETIDGVRVRLLYPPGHDANAETTLDALRFSLPHFSARYGRYPYSVLTVVHPPQGARNAGGMEYPTLITTGGPWNVGWFVRAVEAVTIHELGHQWFYGLVGTDEHAWPFLDEGLTTYAEALAMNERYGKGSLMSIPGLAISDDRARRVAATLFAHDDVVALPAAEFATFRNLGALVYGRTATILRTVANVHGEPAMRRALGRYARRYRFQHPDPRHLLAIFREVLGDQTAETIRTALFDRGWVDYVASDLKSVRARDPAGVFDRDGTRETLEQDDSKEHESWVGRVLVYRHGTLRFPVDVDLVAADGTRVRRYWDGRQRWTALTYEGRSPLVAAIVDPELKIELDQNLMNNATSADGGGAPRVLERTIYWAQLALSMGGP